MFYKDYFDLLITIFKLIDIKSLMAKLIIKLITKLIIKSTTFKQKYNQLANNINKQAKKN